VGFSQKENFYSSETLLEKKSWKKWTQYARNSLVAPSLRQAPLGQSGPLEQIAGDVLGYIQVIKHAHALFINVIFFIRFLYVACLLQL
jgi:hypothetical protein